MSLDYKYIPLYLGVFCKGVAKFNDCFDNKIQQDMLTWPR